MNTGVLHLWQYYQYLQVTATIHAKSSCDLLLFLINYCASRSDHCYCTFQKLHFAIFFPPETIVLRILWVRTKNSERLTPENDTWRINASIIIIHYLYGHCTGIRRNGMILAGKQCIGKWWVEVSLYLLSRKNLLTAHMNVFILGFM
jgi:hypothetical protein